MTPAKKLITFAQSGAFGRASGCGPIFREAINSDPQIHRLTVAPRRKYPNAVPEKMSELIAQQGQVKAPMVDWVVTYPGHFVRDRYETAPRVN